MLNALTTPASEPHFLAGDRVEYHAGDLPIILVSAHDGGLRPETIANRTTRHHTGKSLVDGVRIEVALPDVQDPDYRARFTAATVAVLREFLPLRC